METGIAYADTMKFTTRLPETNKLYWPPLGLRDFSSLLIQAMFERKLVIYLSA
jgi:hypothetical protein